jgi:hypothetical protein
LIDACKPYGHSFPQVAGYSTEEQNRARQIWQQLQ